MVSAVAGMAATAGWVAAARAGRGGLEAAD